MGYLLHVELYIDERSPCHLNACGGRTAQLAYAGKARVYVTANSIYNSDLGERIYLVHLHNLDVLPGALLIDALKYIVKQINGK